jgi:hypothetical protein
LKHIFLAILGAAIFAVAGIAPSLADGSGNVLASQTKAFSGSVTSATTGSRVADAMMDFGNPPSGEIPILYNDHHVYAKPDTLRQGRVLAALVKNGTLMVPLRSMFEQMGATVSFDPGSKSVTASKPGSQVQVTLGKNEVIINGESRPLDVPPMMYQGVLLVPVRVISEALGAYVQWVPEQHLAVVRYIPPTPVPTPAPTAVPTAVPTPAPSPTPKPIIAYIQGGYTRGQVANEFTNGNTTSNGQVGSGAFLFNPLAFKIDFRQDIFQSANDSVPGGMTTFNTIDGGTATVPQFTSRQSTIDGRLEGQFIKPWINIGVAWLQASTHYGYPIVSGPGAGLEKLPDLAPGHLGWYGSAFYYWNTRGQYTVQTGPNTGLKKTLEYQIYKYDIGIDYVLGDSPFYLAGGFSGDRYQAKQAAPSNETHAGPYVELGIKF